jgi:hypothetical protein
MKSSDCETPLMRCSGGQRRLSFSLKVKQAWLTNAKRSPALNVSGYQGQIGSSRRPVKTALLTRLDISRRHCLLAGCQKGDRPYLLLDA